jgi:molybdate transport system substrate-binding protein
MFITARTRRPIIVLLMVAMTIVAGCGDSAPSSSNQVELTVSAAASLTDSLSEIQTLYTGKHANITIRFNFASSGSLRQQIEQGAPVDLFLSADLANMQILTDKQFVEANQQAVIVKNELVVVVPKDSQTAVAKLENLAQPSVKTIAAGDPLTVPAGNYTKEALTKANIWNSIQSKLVLAKDVRQVLTYVETGNADAGFVYHTDAKSSKQVKVAFSLDPSTYSPIQYAAGIVKSTKHLKEAQDFYAFLQSKEAQIMFIKYGFSVSPSPR